MESLIIPRQNKMNKNLYTLGELTLLLKARDLYSYKYAFYRGRPIP